MAQAAGEFAVTINCSESSTLPNIFGATGFALYPAAFIGDIVDNIPLVAGISETLLCSSAMCSMLSLS
jgi:hypothetical protein